MFLKKNMFTAQINSFVHNQLICFGCKISFVNVNAFMKRYLQVLIVKAAILDSDHFEKIPIQDEVNLM